MGSAYLPSCGDSGAAADGSADVKVDVGDTGADAPPVTCPSGKEPKDDPTCVTNDLGVFVSAAGNDADPGTKEKPVATLGAALTKAGSGGKGKVFVCEGSYTESATIKATVGVYGGFKCSDWSYTGTKPKFAGAKPDFVIKVDGASGVTLADLELDGKDGAPNSGESSVALALLDAQSVSITRSALRAGLGAQGVNGKLTPFTYPVQSEINGFPASPTDAGAANAFTKCSGGGVTKGGAGGASGFPGSPGEPDAGGGKGGDTSGTCGVNAGNGGAGGTGPAGTTGVGASVSGTLSNAGWSPGGGAKGGVGSVGQGGGGGGGYLGSGGGGGGAGGCGGAAGEGGGGGGASIALLALNATVGLVSSELASGNAGNAGSGAAGQPGQTPGGFFGVGNPPACQGGNGGAGGAGGAGGGGAGGISVGILYKGTKPVTDSATDGKITVGTKGNKGLGGASPTNDGIDGVAQAVLQAP